MSNHTTLCANVLCANSAKMNGLVLETSADSNSGAVTSSNNSVPLLTVKNTNTDAASGAVIQLKSHPSDNVQADLDEIGLISFVGVDAAGALAEYGAILCSAPDTDAGGEEGKLSINLAVAGARTEVMSLTAGTTAQASVLSFSGVLKGTTDAQDNPIQQSDGTEVARLHQGDIVPTSGGTSTSLSAGTGFGFRRRILTLGSGNDDNTLTLTAADSGCIVYLTPTNAVSLILPLIGTEVGWFCDVIIASNVNKAFTIKTSGQDGNDNITMFCNATDAVAADVGGTDHDILTFTNALAGSRIELINCAGGASERWHAYIRSMDTVDGSIA